MMKTLYIAIAAVLLFPLQLPELDDRTYEACANGVSHELTHVPQHRHGTERAKVKFPWLRGDSPTEAVDEPAAGRIIFGDGAHGVLGELCDLDATRI